ncbi:ATP-dependent DNA ligase [Streptomyces sp. NPDC047869]|uniref:ATP-dependent DNA ligase n=1 Tax=Streptomyces sp. NPDC047869 TaxID=3154709 RepID=UPI00345434A5
MTWSLPEPMLSVATDSPELTTGWAAEPKWDGFRAAVCIDADTVMLRSRRGTQMGPAFPEIVVGTAQLPDQTALDGELIVWDWEQGQLSFEQLQNRLHGRGAGAARAAEQWPAQFVAFDLLRLSGTDTTAWPYTRRRAALEELFTGRGLLAPWALCPSTTDPAMVREWLTWGTVRIEGVVLKRLNDPYRPSVRGWRKYKTRETTEAIVGAVTGPPTAPGTLLLGRYDISGRFQYVGRTTTLARTVAGSAAALLTPATSGHPWAGWTFATGWGSRQPLDANLVNPDLVVEVGVDTARDAAGRWRHPARFHRLRPDLQPGDVERLTSPTD